MLLNELAQWAVLILLGLFVLGLTRQLGEMLVSPRQRLGHSRGPRLGKSLPPRLLPAHDRPRLQALMSERDSKFAAVLVVGEGCPRCATLLEGVRDHGSPNGAPIVVVTTGSGTAHSDLVGAVADFVVLLGDDALDEEDLTAKPFVLIVDRSLKIRHKQVTWDLQEAFQQWTEPNPDSPAGPELTSDGLNVVMYEGRRSI